ncbi:hypothetical protein M0804_002394 [Polistes exclamans]|nr:hypothetical protein M0804_002394 [Polistes exclamans]
MFMQNGAYVTGGVGVGGGSGGGSGDYRDRNRGARRRGIGGRQTSIMDYTEIIRKGFTQGTLINPLDE